MNKCVISKLNWERLVELNKGADWAEKGVFATGIGPGYSKGGLLFVGKYPGPLGKNVGSAADQNASSIASLNWMIERRNPKSPLWKFIEQISPTRQDIAWTNICKMDRIGGNKRPTGNQWKQIAKACVAALTDEIHSLEPKVIVFTTAGQYSTDIDPTLKGLGYTSRPLDFNDGYTSVFSNSQKTVIKTRDPQGWKTADRNRVICLIESCM